MKVANLTVEIKPEIFLFKVQADVNTNVYTPVCVKILLSSTVCIQLAFNVRFTLVVLVISISLFNYSNFSCCY